MRKDPYTILLIGFAMLVLAIAGILHFKQKPQVITKEKVIYKTKTVNKIDKVKLTDWIYHNSFRVSYQQAHKYADIILRQPYPLLVASIIKQESSFNQTATNRVKTTVLVKVKKKSKTLIVKRVKKILVVGLMQIYLTQNHLKQLKDAGIIKTSRDLFNPINNIKAGVFILEDIIRINKGNLRKSLEMYCGKKAGYSRRVLETLGQLSLEVK